MKIVFRIIKKYGEILSKHQKIRIMELGVLMIISGIMEMYSVYLIIPFTTAVMMGDRAMENRLIGFVCNLLSLDSYRGFLVFLAIIMGILFLVKNIFMLFETMIQNRFVFNNMVATQRRLLYAYMMQPYEYYLGAKSGEILNVINGDTNAAFDLLTVLLGMASEVVVTLILVVMLLQINVLMTVVMTVMLVLMSAMVQFAIRPILQSAGERNRNASAAMNQSLVQSIQGIKEVKVMRREGFFMDKFGQNGNIFVRTIYINRTLIWSPRYIMEAIAMLVFFILIAVLIYRGMPLEQIVPLLSGIVMAAYRLLPSVNRISQAMSSLAYGEPSIDKMIVNLKNVPKVDVPVSMQESTGLIKELKGEINFKNITYKYPTGETDVLEDANMEIKKGMSVGIVGTSGAGKTTAVDILLGLLQPQRGQILIDGVDIYDDIDGWLSNIGYIPQSIFMLDGSIKENVVFGMNVDAIDDELVWQALKEAAIDEFVRSLPEGLATQIGERGVRLSGGQRQRIGIARALFRNPSILVFDEATSALDNATEAEIMESINGLHGHKTMIIIAHRLTTIENCDIVYRVENQKITLERKKD